MGLSPFMATRHYISEIKFLFLFSGFPLRLIVVPYIHANCKIGPPTPKYVYFFPSVKYDKIRYNSLKISLPDVMPRPQGLVYRRSSL